jgi:hypothetical protein
MMHNKTGSYSSRSSENVSTTTLRNNIAKVENKGKEEKSSKTKT